MKSAVLDPDNLFLRYIVLHKTSSVLIFKTSVPAVHNVVMFCAKNALNVLSNTVYNPTANLHIVR